MFFTCKLSSTKEISFPNFLKQYISTFVFWATVGALRDFCVSYESRWNLVYPTNEKISLLFARLFLGNCGCVARLSNVSLQKNKLKKLISLLQIYCTKLNFQKLHFLFEFTAETSIYKCHINFPAENSPFLSRPRSRRESFSNWKDRDPGIVCT